MENTDQTGMAGTLIPFTSQLGGEDFGARILGLGELPILNPYTECYISCPICSSPNTLVNHARIVYQDIVHIVVFYCKDCTVWWENLPTVTIQQLTGSLY